MKTIEGVLIERKLGTFIHHYQIENEGFENFTAEAHLFALLEWSRYLRPNHSEKDRLQYLYEKCWEYTDPTKFVVFKIVDTPYGYAVAVEEEEDALPF